MDRIVRKCVHEIMCDDILGKEARGGPFVYWHDPLTNAGAHNPLGFLLLKSSSGCGCLSPQNHLIFLRNRAIGGCHRSGGGWVRTVGT